MSRESFRRALDTKSSANQALVVGLHEGPSDSTRTEACKWSRTALAYAMWVDKGPHPDTREAAYKDQRYRYLYKEVIDKPL